MVAPIFISKSEILKKFQNNNSRFIDIDKIFITKEVVIGNNNVIYPNVYLIGNVVIGNNNHIQMGVIIENSIITNNNLIGPYSFIRKNSLLKDDIVIGPYCEIKNSKLENKTIVSHKSFVGNCIVGINSSIGAGTTITNFDGKKIVNTSIGANVFIGANVTLVAPLTITDNVIVAAGSTITESITRPAKVFARIKDMTLKEL